MRVPPFILRGSVTLNPVIFCPNRSNVGVCGLMELKNSLQYNLCGVIECPLFNKVTFGQVSQKDKTVQSMRHRNRFTVSDFYTKIYNKIEREERLCEVS